MTKVKERQNRQIHDCSLVVLVYRNLLGLRTIRPRLKAKSGDSGTVGSGAPIETSDESVPEKGGLLAVATPSSDGRPLNGLGSSASILKQFNMLAGFKRSMHTLSMFLSSSRVNTLSDLCRTR